MGERQGESGYAPWEQLGNLARRGGANFAKLTDQMEGTDHPDAPRLRHSRRGSASLGNVILVCVLALSGLAGYATLGARLAHSIADTRAAPSAVAATAQASLAGGAADALRAMDEIITQNRFMTERPLFTTEGAHRSKSYEHYLGSPFISMLESLDGSGHWIDMGSGDGRAIRDFYDRYHRRGLRGAAANAPQTTAVAKAPGDTAGLANRYPEFRALYGRLLEQIPPGEIGKADVISDVWGPLTYSPDMGIVFNRYAELLRPGGQLHAALPVSHTFGTGAGGTIGLPTLLGEWINDAQGLRLHEASMGPDSAMMRIRLERTDGPLRLPALTTESFKPGTPPRRIYSYQGPAERLAEPTIVESGRALHRIDAVWDTDLF